MTFSFRNIVRIHPLIALLIVGLALSAWVPDILSESDYRPYLATMVMTVLVGLELMAMLYRIGVTRFYVALPVVLYVGLTALFPSLHVLWQNQVAVFLLCSVVLLVHGSYMDLRAQKTVFGGTMIILIASAFVTSSVWLIPTFWIALIYQQTFTLRSSLAALLAMAVYALYYLLAIVLFGVRVPYETCLPAFLMGISACSLLEWIMLGVVILGAITLSIFSLWRTGKDGRDMRFSVVLFSLILFQSVFMTIFAHEGNNHIPLVLFATVPIIVNVLKQKDFVL